jgi:ATP-binding cassette subfamily B protein
MDERRAHRVEIREPGRAAREVRVTDRLEVGRQCDGIVVSNPQVSRRHLAFSVTSDGLSVSDLGSTNGTRVNGTRITGETLLRRGDRVSVADVELVVVDGTDGAPPPKAPAVEPRPRIATRPLLDELTEMRIDRATLRFRPGTAGASAAPALASAVKRARRRLAGLGSEPWGVSPQICLVDPIPDPDRPGEVMTEGTVVDPARGEIWMVVTSEAPPEAPERPLALFFGASLPSADELRFLLDGYGLFVAETPDPDPQLRDIGDLPLIVDADKQVASAMALSFVRFLIERGGRSDFLHFLTAPAGRVDVVAEELYGASLAALEEAWHQKLLFGSNKVETGRFLRLSARYLRPHARRETEMFVYMVLGLAFNTVFPFVTRRLFDTALPSGKFSEVLRLLLFLAGAFVISLLAGLRRAYLTAYVGGAVVRDVRDEMFDRLQSLSNGWFTRHQQGDVLSRLFSDVAVLEVGLSETLREGVFQLLSLVVSFVVLLLLNVPLTLVVIAGAPLVALIYRGMAAGAQKRSLAVQEQTSGLIAVAAENYSAQPVIKAFGLEARERGRFGRAAERLFLTQRRLALFGGVFNLSVTMIVTLLRLVVLGLGSWLILQNHLTVGGLVAFLGVMGEVLAPVAALTGIGQQIQASTGALVRINEVLDEIPEIKDEPGAEPMRELMQEIRLSGVTFSYIPGRPVLENIEAVIAAGSRVAFVGPSGAGKSSILQLVARFYDPEEGEVLFDGHDIRHYTVASVRDQIGVVFQDPFLFGSTVRDNIALGKPGASDAEVEAAARAAEIDEFIDSMPQRYDTLVGERGGRLSGGQRQRISIARALIRDPRLLILDEATSALDPRTERLITDTLERASRGRTTIAVTHRLTSIAAYDRIFVVVAGRLVEQGTHEQLLDLGGTYARLWAEQTGAVVPREAPFDAAEALGRVPIFAALTSADLGAIAAQLRVVDLRPGEQIPEGGGRLILIRRGSVRTLLPGIDGQLVPSVELGTGDAFGLAALLGNETGATLEAIDSASVLVLDDESISSIAARHPSVADALRHGSHLGPEGGQRLSRLTFGPKHVVDGAQIALPPADANVVRRNTGAFRSVGP